jgi:hypothetical protein
MIEPDSFSSLDYGYPYRLKVQFCTMIFAYQQKNLYSHDKG